MGFQDLIFIMFWKSYSFLINEEDAVILTLKINIEIEKHTASNKKKQIIQYYREIKSL